MHTCKLQFVQAPLTLQILTASDSVLTGVQKGLLACTNLTDLDLQDCRFEAESQHSRLCIGPDEDKVLIPEQLSKLTALTMLNMKLECNSDNNLISDISWVYRLASLKRLDLIVDGSFKIASELTQLQQVTQLSVKTGNNCRQWHATCVVDWGLIQSLHYIELTGPIESDSCVLQLTAVCSLREVKFKNAWHTCTLFA